MRGGVARRSNLRFGTPPGVSLCSGEGFTRLELENPLAGMARQAGHPSTEVFLGMADIKDAFHRFRLSPEFASWFCL